MTRGLVTVFGGSGFLGKHVIRALVKDGWRVRVPMRRPHTGQDLRVIGNVGQIQLVQANLRFQSSVERAVAGSDAVINLTGILFESGKQTFDAVHVQGVETIAKAAHEAGIANVVHMSAIGANKDAKSEYSSSRGRGEDVLRNIMPSADILRASILFGPEDSFFNRFAQMANIAPALPLMGGGESKFQPVYVADVASAVARRVAYGSNGSLYELGGPKTYSFKELMEFLLETIDKKRLLVPVPWFAANMMGFIGEMSGWLPFLDPFLTRNQVLDLKNDNVVGAEVKTFTDLGITPETIEAIVPTYLVKYRHYGQFHERST